MSDKLRLASDSPATMRAWVRSRPIAAEIVDILSFTLIPEAKLKQTRPADGNVAARVDRAVSEILRLHPEIPSKLDGAEIRLTELTWLLTTLSF